MQSVSPYASSLIRNAKQLSTKTTCTFSRAQQLTCNNHVGCLKIITGLFDYEKSLELMNHMDHGGEVINIPDIM